MPNADFPRLSADPTLAAQLLPSEGFPNTDYMIMNNNKEPFDKLDVRRALSMAIDRDRMSQILNGRATPLAASCRPASPAQIRI